jgi:hypothetical protein
VPELGPGLGRAVVGALEDWLSSRPVEESS